MKFKESDWKGDNGGLGTSLVPDGLVWLFPKREHILFSSSVANVTLIQEVRVERPDMLQVTARPLQPLDLTPGEARWESLEQGHYGIMATNTSAATAATKISWTFSAPRCYEKQCIMGRQMGSSTVDDLHSHLKLNLNIVNHILWTEI